MPPYTFSELPQITDKVFLEISIDDQPSGRIVIGLFGEVVPRTVENFKRLCACDAGKGKLSGIDLCYKNTPIHRISKFESTSTILCQCQQMEIAQCT